MGDSNSRVGEKSYLSEHTNLNRYVNIPADDFDLNHLPIRKSHDVITNRFGNRLLTLCKECSVCILNGRLEQGLFTCYNLSRNTVGASVVDYVISNYEFYDKFVNMKIHELSEFSDHCAIEFSFKLFDIDASLNNTYDRINWNTASSSQNTLFNL